MCDVYANRHLIFFVNECSVVVIFQSDDDAGSSLKAISKNTVWVVLMTGGGHFAGAVFQGWVESLLAGLFSLS